MIGRQSLASLTITAVAIAAPEMTTAAGLFGGLGSLGIWLSYGMIMMVLL